MEMQERKSMLVQVFGSSPQMRIVDFLLDNKRSLALSRYQEKMEIEKLLISKTAEEAVKEVAGQI